VIILGLYDTIILPTPLSCDRCGSQKKKIQTHLFEKTLSEYEVGDILEGPVVSGILRESLFCFKCSKKFKKPDAFIIVKKHVFIDVVFNFEEAEDKLLEFGLTDLNELYQEQFKQKYNNKNALTRLKSLIRHYITLLDGNRGEKYRGEEYTLESILKEFKMSIDGNDPKKKPRRLDSNKPFMRYKKIYKEKINYKGGYLHLKGMLEKYCKYLRLNEDSKQRILSDNLDFFDFPFWDIKEHVKLGEMKEVLKSILADTENRLKKGHDKYSLMFL
jgi:hypothetical protein